MKKKQIIIIAVAVALCAVIGTVIGVVASSANGKAQQEALKSYIFEQENQNVSEELILPATIGGFKAEWSSNNQLVKIEKRAEDYLAKVGYTDTTTQVELTVKLGKQTKVYTVNVKADEINDFANAYNFVNNRATVSNDFDLDTSVEYHGKTATITWSVEEQYADYLEVSGNKCLVTPGGVAQAVKLVAQFSYNGATCQKKYNMTVVQVMDHLQEVDYWYNNTGVSVTMSGYVVEIATLYSEQYKNVSLYIVDDDFCCGYYLYRVGCDAENGALLKVGAHVTVTGTTNTDYNGLIETNAGGTLVVDKDVAPLTDVQDKVYAIDNDVIANSPATVYHQSTMVSLTNWKVKELKTKPTSFNTATILTLEKGKATVSVAVSKYLEGAYKGADNEKWTALLGLYDTIKVGDYVSVKGILGNYKGHQILLLDASHLVKEATPDTTTEFDANKVYKAINAVKNAVTTNVPKLACIDTTFELPTTSNDVAVKYEVVGQSRAVTIQGGKFTVAPNKEEKACIKATFTIGEYTTVYFFYIASQKLDAQGLIDLFIVPQNITGDFELNALGKWTIKQGTTVSFDSKVANKVIVNRAKDDETVIFTAEVTVDGVTLTKDYTCTVKKWECATMGHKCENNVCVVCGTTLSEDQVVIAAYALAKGASLTGTYFLTGEVTEIKTNVIITVNGKTFECYKLKDASTVKVGDKITVTGVIKNYNGTVEFDSGCTFVTATETVHDCEKDGHKYVANVCSECSDTLTEAKVVELAKALAVGETLPGTYALTGTITEITEAYSDQYKNVTFKITVGDFTITIFRIKGTGVENLKVGDTVKITGTITYYKGKDESKNLLEFTNCTAFEVITNEG